MEARVTNLIYTRARARAGNLIFRFDLRVRLAKTTTDERIKIPFSHYL